MKKIFGLLLVLSFAMVTPGFAAPIPVDDNLLSNSGFDSGDLTSWTEASPGNTDVSATTNQSLSPNYSAEFLGWNEGKNQTITLKQGFGIDPTTQYYFGVYIESLQNSNPLRDGAEAWASLRWYKKSGGTLLGTVETARLSSYNDVWEYFGSSAVSPADATYAVFYLNMFSPKMTGDSRSVYFDNAIVTTTPEPISSVLFLMGGVALVARKMRKKA